MRLERKQLTVKADVRLAILNKDEFDFLRRLFSLGSIAESDPIAITLYDRNNTVHLLVKEEGSEGSELLGAFAIRLFDQDYEIVQE